METYRDLNPKEKKLIMKLLANDFPGRNELVNQIENAKVKDVFNDGTIEFLINSDILAEVEQRIPVEAVFHDKDGGVVEILLHVVEGKLYELEFVRHENPNNHDYPDIDNLDVKIN